jgi:CheY-like chemotaxis protein
MEKERSVKLLIISILFMLIAALTVVFAALSTSLNINGTAYLDAAKWGIKFENLSSPTAWGTATTTGAAKIEETKSAEITGINVSLSTPGDQVRYSVNLVNEGTINAKIDKIEKTELTEEQQRYLSFKVIDVDTLSEVKENDVLKAGETKQLLIQIMFIDDITKEDLPKQTSTISLSYKLNFVQINDLSIACTQFEKKDAYSIGDEISLCNSKTGKSEDFYVMRDNGDTVEAFAKSGVGEVNVILMDIMMPVMDGLEATREIRTMNRSDASAVVIIAMTANAFTEDKTKALKSGMDDYLTKPLESEKLIRALSRFL